MLTIAKRGLSVMEPTQNVGNKDLEPRLVPVYKVLRCPSKRFAQLRLARGHRARTPGVNTALYQYSPILLGTPSIQDLPERTNIEASDLAILTCEVSGVPEPYVTWTKDGDTNIPRAQFKNNGRILVIKNVLPLDSGVYECKASNKFGESRSSTMLIVAGKLDRYSTT